MTMRNWHIYICDRAIDNVSLCRPEVDFFHSLVKLSLGESMAQPSAYIASCLELYDRMTDLAVCQLGPNIRKCLEASRTVAFT